MTADRPFIIYMHTSPSGKRYVGQTRQSPNERWKNGIGYKGCKYFERAIEKYGWESIKHEILCVVHSQELANSFERYYIDKYKTADKRYGYNLTSGGSSGYQYSDEVRAKLSRIARERGISKETIEKMHATRRKNGYKRRPMTDDEKEALSRRMSGPNHPLYGKKLPRDVVEKRAASQRGRKASEETRRRQSKGLRNSEKVKAKQKPVLQIDDNGNVVKRYESLSQASRENNVTKQAIRAVCTGLCNTACGFRWAYEDEGMQDAAAKVVAQRSNRKTIGLPVIQLDLDGNELARFDITVDASKKTGLTRSGISECCRGKRHTSQGYVWKYLDRSFDLPQ